MFSTLLAICEGNHTGHWLITPDKRAIKVWCFSYVVRQNRPLNKQSSGQWFKMQWCSIDITAWHWTGDKLLPDPMMSCDPFYWPIYVSPDLSFPVSIMYAAQGWELLSQLSTFCYFPNFSALFNNLTGVATAQLQWHLSNMNAIQSIQELELMQMHPKEKLTPGYFDSKLV